MEISQWYQNEIFLKKSQRKWESYNKILQCFQNEIFSQKIANRMGNAYWDLGMPPKMRFFIEKLQNKNGCV